MDRRKAKRESDWHSHILWLDFGFLNFTKESVRKWALHDELILAQRHELI